MNKYILSIIIFSSFNIKTETSNLHKAPNPKKPKIIRKKLTCPKNSKLKILKNNQHACACKNKELIWNQKKNICQCPKGKVLVKNKCINKKSNKPSKQSENPTSLNTATTIPLINIAPTSQDVISNNSSNMTSNITPTINSDAVSNPDTSIINNQNISTAINLITECKSNLMLGADNKCICPEGSQWDGNQCICPSGMSLNENNKCECPERSIWSNENNSCVCLANQDLDKNDTCVCAGGQIWDNDSCVCPNGQLWYNTFNQCKTREKTIEENEQVLQNNCFYAKGSWDKSTSVCTCPGNMVWNGTTCVCPDNTSPDLTGTHCMSAQEKACLQDQSTTRQIFDEVNNDCTCPQAFPDFVNNKCIKLTPEITNCQNANGIWDEANNICVSPKCPANSQWLNNHCTSSNELDCINSSGSWVNSSCVCPSGSNFLNNKCVTEKQQNCINSGGDFNQGICACPASYNLNIDGYCVTSALVECAQQGGSWNDSEFKCTCPYNRIWDPIKKVCNCPAGFPISGGTGYPCMTTTECPDGTTDYNTCSKCYGRWDNTNGQCKIYS